MLIGRIKRQAADLRREERQNSVMYGRKQTRYVKGEVQKQMRILICDDDREFCESLEELLKEYSRIRLGEAEIATAFTSRETLIVLEAENFDLVFLDIELDEENGVRIGRRLREEFQNHSTQIIYISAKREYAMELFTVRPFDFLIKPIGREALFREMDRFLEVYESIVKCFSYQRRGGTVRCRTGDILYFQSFGKKIMIVRLCREKASPTKDRAGTGTLSAQQAVCRDEFYSPLREVYEKLRNDRFFYCHKSLLVNYENIVEFYYDRLVLVTGEELEISQGKRKEVRNLAGRWGLG